MATSKSDIRRWLTENLPDKATHMAVVCDTYDHSDYPVYVLEGEDAREKTAKYIRGENMTQLMEVYNLSMDIEEQMNEHRCFNY